MTTQQIKPARPIARVRRAQKYEMVAELLVRRPGVVLDIGARDRRLERMLDRSIHSYKSADADNSSGAHDYVIDLEKPLPFADGQFDYVIALDVLEHVERIHFAFAELARVAAKGVIIALPNMATLSRRLRFVLGANLGTMKYALLPEHQGDRHRWLTVYGEMNRFVEANGAVNGLVLEQRVEEPINGRILSRFAMLSYKAGIWPASILAERCVYFLTRQGAGTPGLMEQPGRLGP